MIGYVLGRSRRLVHVEHVGRLGESFGVLRRVLNVAVAEAYHVLLSCTLLGNAHCARVWRQATAQPQQFLQTCYR